MPSLLKQTHYNNYFAIPVTHALGLGWLSQKTEK
jgi:hypothetical protein